MSRYQDGHPLTQTQTYDISDFWSDQGRVLFDALGQTLIENMNIDRLAARFRQDGFDFWRYSGKDLYVLPPLVGAVLYYRGLDYRLDVRGTRVRVQIAAVSDFIESRDELIGAFGIEISTPVKGVNLVAVAGMYAGRPSLDFVGIATDLETVRRAIYLVRSR